MTTNEIIIERLEYLENIVLRRNKGNNINNRRIRNSNFNIIDYKPIFIHIPKTSGRYIQSILKTSVNYNIHTPSYKIRNKHEQEFDKCYSFCFIRNPYSRFVSACLFSKIEHINKFCKIFDSGLSEWIDTYNIEFVEHFYSQSYFIKDSEKTKILVNDIFKYENLKESVDILIDKGLNKLKKFKYKEGRSNNYNDFLNDESKKIIEKKFKEDFELYESY